MEEKKETGQTNELPWEEDGIDLIENKHWIIRRADVEGFYTVEIDGVLSLRIVDAVQLIEHGMAKAHEFELLKVWKNSDIRYLPGNLILRNFADTRRETEKRTFLIRVNEEGKLSESNEPARYFECNLYELLRRGVATVANPELVKKAAGALPDFSLKDAPWESDGIVFTPLAKDKVVKGSKEGKYVLKIGGITVNCDRERLLGDGLAQTIEEYAQSAFNEQLSSKATCVQVSKEDIAYAFEKTLEKKFSYQGERVETFGTTEDLARWYDLAKKGKFDYAAEKTNSAAQDIPYPSPVASAYREERDKLKNLTAETERKVLEWAASFRSFSADPIEEGKKIVECERMKALKKLCETNKDFDGFLNGLLAVKMKDRAREKYLQEMEELREAFLTVERERSARKNIDDGGIRPVLSELQKGIDSAKSLDLKSKADSRVALSRADGGMKIDVEPAETLLASLRADVETTLSGYRIADEGDDEFEQCKELFERCYAILHSYEDLRQILEQTAATAPKYKKRWFDFAHRPRIEDEISFTRGDYQITRFRKKKDPSFYELSGKQYAYKDGYWVNGLYFTKEALVYLKLAK